VSRSTGKKPPLAQAAREFLTAMTFPPTPERGPSSNTVYAAIIQALLWHARYLRAEDNEVTVTPSSQQLADVLHCNTRTVRRLLESVIEQGMVTRVVRNGHLSNTYVIHKHSKLLKKSGSVRAAKDDHPTKGKREDKDVRPDSTDSTEEGGQLGSLGWTTTPSREGKDALFRSNPQETSSGVMPDADFLVSCSAPSTTRDGSDTHANGLPLTNANGAGIVEQKAMLAADIVGTDTTFFCPRCNQENTGLNYQHECAHCTETIDYGLLRPRTEVEGRNHMVSVLEKLMTDDEARYAVYRNLTAAEAQWIKDCGMVFADEMRETEEADKRAELLERCGVSEDEAL
jgi:hypothetical protein